MRLPWVTFSAYMNAINEQAEKEQDAKLFKNKGVQDEWTENKEDWLKAQPRGAKRVNSESADSHRRGQ